MRSALACGVVALAFLAGTLIVGGWRVHGATRATPVRAIVSLAVGMAALTPILALLAQFRLFVPAAIGGAGWLGLAVWMVMHRRARWHYRVRTHDVLIALAAVAYLAVAVHGRDEPWGAGRDQQVYAEFAVLLADTGRATINVAPQDGADAGLLHAVGSNRDVNRYLGVTRTASNGAILEASYLPLGWPAWLAFAYAVGGYPALHAANALTFVVGAMLLYPVLRRSAGSAFATASVVTLLALPTSLWIAGISLSEPLAMVVWLAMMALFALRERCALRWTAFLVFAAATVRIDALLLVPALIAAQFMQAALEGSESQARSAREFAFASIVSLGAAIAWYAMFQDAYLRDNAEYVLEVAVAALVTAGLTACGARVRGWARRLLVSRNAAWIVVAVVVALGLYCLALRPVLHPFAIIHNGSGLDGTRDYREDSLRNLAAYVGWPLLLAAFAGAVFSLIRFASPATPLAQRVFLLTGFAYAALYLWAPLVSPDHPWAIRRFVPIVIPMVVALAAIALRNLLHRRAGGRAVVAGVLMVGAACEAAAASGAPLLTLRENRGAVAWVASLDAAMPDALVVADLPAGNMAIVLSIARQRRVVVADFQQADSRAAVARWLEGKGREGKPAWLLIGESILPAGARTEIVMRSQFERRALARTVHPPARGVDDETIRMVLARTDGLDANIAFEGFGGTPAWRIADSGFYRADTTPFGTLRMTNGVASLDVPSELLRDAAALEFKWYSWAPHGESRETNVRVAGLPAWHGTLTPGVTTTEVPLPQALPSGSVRIEVDSAAFDPRTLDPADYRHRVGVGVLGIRALRATDGPVRTQQTAPAGQAR